MKKMHTPLIGALLAFILWIPTSSSQDCFFTTASSQSTVENANICVDVSVHGFIDISSFQFSFVWDPLILDYDRVENINLPNPSSAQFGTPLVDAGILTFFWLDAQQGWDLPDRTVAFSVCFDVEPGTDGQLSDVDFSGDATDIEVYDSDLNLIEFHSIPGVVSVGGGPITTIFLDGCENNGNCESNFDLVVEGGVDPLNYAWTGPNNFMADTKDLSNFLPGDYTVTVTDANGASTNRLFTLNGSVPTVVDTLISIVECFEFNNGAVDITVQGGATPYVFAWSNGSSFEDISGLPPGDYTVTITDAANCELIETFTVAGNAPIELQAITVDCVSDAGNDGFVTIQVIGGSGNYSFDWSFGPSTSTGVFGGLAPGDYEVSVTDEFNCPYTIIPFGVSAGIVSAEDVVACVGQGTTLGVDAPSGEVFAWTPATFLSCTDCPNPVATATSDIEYAISVIDSSGCIDNDTLQLTVTEGCVWPGDTDLSKEVTLFDLLFVGLSAGETGPVRAGANISWNAQVADDWMSATPVSMVNSKHADSNGDGTVDVNDTIAIADNLGEMHNFSGSGSSDKRFTPNDELSTQLLGGPILRVTTPDTLFLNNAYSLPIELGDAGNTIDAVYGLSFSVFYDTEEIVAGSANVELAGSWLGNLGADLVMMQRVDAAAGRIDVAITGMDLMNRTGSGQIALLNFSIGSDLGNELATFNIDNEVLITNVEGAVVVSTAATSSVVADVNSSVHELNLSIPLTVYPNPAQDVFFIDSGSATIESVELFDLSGKLMPLQKTSRDQKTIFVEEDWTGSFLLRVKTNQGTAVRRLVLLK